MFGRKCKQCGTLYSDIEQSFCSAVCCLKAFREIEAKRKALMTPLVPNRSDIASIYSKRSFKKNKAHGGLSKASVIRGLKSQIRDMRAKLHKQRQASKQTQPGFYDTQNWKSLRYEVLKEHMAKHGRSCLLCGMSNVVLHVDHIKPRSKFPSLSYAKSNLQVLCALCNQGKSNTDFTDWRRK